MKNKKRKFYFPLKVHRQPQGSQGCTRSRPGLGSKRPVYARTGTYVGPHTPKGRGGSAHSLQRQTLDQDPLSKVFTGRLRAAAAFHGLVLPRAREGNWDPSFQKGLECVA